jgi:hypothetical protein
MISHLANRNRRTLMSTTAKAADNGSTTTTDKTVPAQREHGMDRLREDECYHLTDLIGRALGESEHLVRKVHNKAFNRTLDHDGSKGTAPLDRDEIQRILSEAGDCAQVAVDYLYRAVRVLNDGESPF